jgi:surface antigen
VAWRINSRLGVHFTNQYKGVNWGNANTWDEAARETGITINSTPKPGCIAQSNAGSAGHVAWVTAVGTDTVEIEEYNYGVREGYGKRTVAKGSFNYIHIKV